LSVNRILVVDDDPSVRFLLRLIFEYAGHSVSEAQHGQAALIKIKDTLPDLVVTDMMMPVMDGGALIKHLRSHPRTEGLLILAVTANPEATEAAIGANAVMAKPFAQSALVAVANGLLAQRELKWSA
jgi:CheY-like chemotaxis protein